MTPRFAPLLLAIAAACATAEAPLTDRDTNRQAATEAIRAANARAAAALTAGDTRGAGEIYADNATVMSPDGHTLVGRAAIDSSTRGDVAGRTMPMMFAWQADTIEVHGDYAYEVGHGSTIRGVDTTRSQYITFWRKDPDGVWRVHRDFTVPIRARR